MLPEDWREGLLVGRLQTPAGPSPVLVRDGRVHDMARIAPTVSALLELDTLSSLEGTVLGDLESLGIGGTGSAAPYSLLSPVDLQCVKAAGVTFAVSAIERVIEERARGVAGEAAAVRAKLEARVGSSIRSVVPGTAEAAALKAVLIEEGLWSQYLEVAIGPDAEIFTKAPVLSSVGWGAEVGVRSDSSWNNPEPEVVLIANGAGKAVGATLGNDVNLRDFEGRSALLLGKAKDNNASCALGPFIRLFDATFTMDDVRDAVIDLRIEGPEGYRLTGTSSMREISRDPEELLRQALSEHQYPDGFALMLGTLFAPVQDRDEAGRGFTHKPGDIVHISTPRLGALVNRVTTSKAAAPWTMGIQALMANLAARGLL
ncbi:fumarylacetoacetate hydrolase family protein [Pedomonas mirosovicensis]|uniref:fumarylacetoacetate hydrolase family protein n=1 Tax=Pedomonas mirosovicensis TaxID=2908641 RepID=UPI002169084E|nr:fumarylacetoacetate hydrolase family protein [Pedomonas mirosovicensis]MCH8686198.1 fumarylacetoacetate hydrolase family protein [Pedomonas mirosovicensis]